MIRFHDCLVLAAIILGCVILFVSVPLAADDFGDTGLSTPWSGETAASVVLGQGHDDDDLYLVPAAANSGGLKTTHWRSDVVLHNTSKSIAEGLIALLDGSDPTQGMDFSIPPRGTLRLDDVVSDLSPEELVAGLIIGSNQALDIGSRTFTTLPNGGSFGQGIPGVSMHEVEIVNQSARLVGLVQNEAFRTNLGFVNASVGPKVVTSTFFSKSGYWLAERTDEIDGHSFLQLTEVLKSVGLDGHDGVVAEIAVTNPELWASPQGFSAYASMIDNRSGDPVTQIAPFKSGSHVDHGHLSTWDYHSEDVLPAPKELWIDLARHGTGWVAVGEDIAYSYDGRHWDVVFEPWGIGFGAVDSDGDTAVAIGAGGSIATSSNGRDWSVQNIESFEGEFQRMNDLARSADGWVAVGGSGHESEARGFVLRSADGRSWQLEATVDSELNAVEVVGDSLIAVGEETIVVKEDDNDWQSFSYPDTYFLHVASNGDRIVCTWGDGYEFEVVGVVGRIDGGWQEIERIRSVLWLNEVVWNGDVFVGVGRLSGSDSTYGFLVSRDGIDWEMIHELNIFPDNGTYNYSGLIADGGTVVGLDWEGHQIGFLVDGGKERWIPASAHTKGYAGTLWRSDLVLHNASDLPMRIHIDLLPSDDAPQDPQSVELDLSPGSSSTIVDVLDELFDYDGAAALRLAHEEPGLLAFSRLFNRGAEGTYGQTVPSFTEGDLIHTYELGNIVGLRESGDMKSGFRTNLGLMSACAEPMTIGVEFRASDGSVIGSLEQALGPYESTQLNRVLRQLSTTGVESVNASLTTSTPDCAFAAYASIVDNLSGDPVFRSARRIPLTPDDRRKTRSSSPR